MEIKTVNEQWAEFAARLGLERAPEIQRVEMRRAFYGGFSACLFTLRDGIPELPEADGCEALEVYTSELTEFAADVLSGRA
jgi:hypothetical protein